MLLNRGPCFGRPYPHTSYHPVPICSIDSACHFTRNRERTIPNKRGCTLRNIYIHRLEFVPNHKELELGILKKMIIIDCPIMSDFHQISITTSAQTSTYCSTDWGSTSVSPHRHSNA